MKSKKKWLSLVLLIPIFIIAVKFTEGQTNEQLLLNHSISPSYKTIIVKKVISGNLYPKKEIEVKSPISGTLENYYINVGKLVKVGDRIAKIKLIPDPSQLEYSRRNYITTKISFENQRMNYERDSVLFLKGILSKADFEDVRKTFQLSRAEYQSAFNQLKLIEDGTIPNSDISNIITATIDGVIIDAPLEEGISVNEKNTFREGTTIAVIAQVDSFIFKGKAVESDIINLKMGKELTVFPTSNAHFKTHAHLRRVSPKGTLEQGIMKYEFEAILVVPDSITVLSGFNAVAEIIIDKKENVLTIPEKCLSFEKDSVFIHVKENSKFIKKSVKIGISDGINVEIITGIDKTDLVNIDKN